MNDRQRGRRKEGGKEGWASGSFCLHCRNSKRAKGVRDRREKRKRKGRRRRGRVEGERRNGYGRIEKGWWSFNEWLLSHYV